MTTHITLPATLLATIFAALLLTVALPVAAEDAADGVMIGRGAYGRPWWPGVLANQLDPGCGIEEPDIGEQGAIVFEHYDLMIRHYGERNGVRIARKHIGWALERWRDKGLYDQAETTKWRAKLLKLDNPDDVRSGLNELRNQICSAAERMAAA